MNPNQSTITIMRDNKITSALLKLTIPSIIGMLINALYNVIDAYFVSGLGTSQLAAVAVAFPITQVIIGIGLIFGTGAAMCISRQIGENKLDQASITASTAFFTSGISGVIIITVSMLFLPEILSAFGATPTILPFALEYSQIYLSGCILNILFVTMNNILFAEGAAKKVMITMLTGGILNSILDPIFIYKLGFGIAGAAIATIISFAVTLSIYILHIIQKKGVLRISVRQVHFKQEIIFNLLKLGTPIFVFQLLTGAAIGLTNTAAGNYGDSAVAAFGIITRIIALVSYVIFGYVKGLQPIIGYNYGAGRFDRVQEALTISLRWIISYGIIVASIFLLLPEALVSLFSTTDRELVTLGCRILQANSVTFILFGIIMIYATAFLALGNSRKGGILSIAHQGIFFIPAILLLPHIFGIDGIIYAQPLADILTFMLTLLYARNFTANYLQPASTRYCRSSK